MIKIEPKYINHNGGLLHSLRKKSSIYIRGLFNRRYALKKLSINLNKLDRTIVHAHPHLDEYFADLILRSALPEYKLDIDFIEMSIQSRDNDSNCKALWPNAIVLGIGGIASGGSRPLLIFDEHLEKGNREFDSCSQMVTDYISKKIPWPVEKVLKEVNEIDASGGAHDQHIGNLIKTAHNVRFLFKKGDSISETKQDWLSPEWKKTIMDTCLVSIIYCLENKIDLKSSPKEKSDSLRSSLDNFIKFCPFNKDRIFQPTIQRIKSNYLNQANPFKKAKLPISTYSDQLLILSRVCFALEKCWGPKIKLIIMTHFWEIIYQGQASFQEMSERLKTIEHQPSETIQSKFGRFEKVDVHLKKNSPVDSTRCTIDPKKSYKLWLLSGDKTPRLILGNRPMLNVINKRNAGFGVVHLRDSFNCTNVLFKAMSVPQSFWNNFVTLILQEEESEWHAIPNKEGSYAPFLLNGNRSHQYVPTSSLNQKRIIELLIEADK